MNNKCLICLKPSEFKYYHPICIILVKKYNKNNKPEHIVERHSYYGWKHEIKHFVLREGKYYFIRKENIIK